MSEAPHGDASLAQHGIWFTEQALRAGSAYHVPLGVRFDGDLDAAALTAACAAVVRRHPLLATSVAERDGTPLLVRASRDVPVDVVRVAPDELDGAVREATLRPFDLAGGPLARFTLFTTAPREHLLLVVAHHLVFDGESKDVLVRDLAALYTAAVTGSEPALPPTPPPYSEHVDGERERVVRALPAAREYWKGRWRPAPLTLPGLVSPTAGGGVGETVDVPVDGSLLDRLTAAAAAMRLTTFQIVLGALQAVLFRYGNELPAVAIDVSTRTPRHRDAVGVFVNELPVVPTGTPSMAVAEFLARVRADLGELYAHWEVPLARAAQGVAPGTALAPVSVSYRTRAADPDFHGVDATVHPTMPAFAARNTLHLQAVESADALVLGLQHDPRVLARHDVERIAAHLVAFLDAVASDPAVRVCDVPLLTAEERTTVLETWNDTAVGHPGPHTLPELVEAQVDRTPDAIAVLGEDGALTYAELDARANQVAHRLVGAGAGPETLVAICAERSVELVVGLLGIVKAGAAYLPLDPGYPAERLAFMMSDAAAPVLLTQRRLAAAVPHDAEVLRLDEPEHWAGTPATRLPGRARPDAAAYVIYTSGSTGRPKGVVVTHEAIANRLHWMQGTFALTGEDVVLQKTPASFDVSVWEFFWPLLAGARLVLARPDGHRDATYLRDVIAERGVTTVHFVPSMLAAFLDQDGIEACRTLRRTISSGEELPADLVQRFRARLPGELHNLYGPTEAAVDVSWWACGDERGRVPIGRPIDNIRLYVLDEHRNLVPPGVPGELHIGGVGVARGYLRRPELTAERFVPDPFGPPGGRLYRTGDLARHRPDGAIEFLGRIDSQVKVRGVRIEPGEIEAALRRLPSVRDAAVILREDEPGDQRLVAYVVGAAPPADELRAALRRTLPEALVPAAFVPVRELPLGPSGKLDRTALPVPGHGGDGDPAATEARTPVEKTISELWRELLRIDHVGIDDDFFDLGGNSLLATRVLARLRPALGPDAPRLTIMDLFDNSTIRELAALVSGPGEGAQP
jgi:amino acid adenylation domain-containing protein